MLVRSRNDKVIAGVCAGLARRFGTRPLTMRVLFLVSCIIPGPQFIIYLALWLLIPQER